MYIQLGSLSTTARLREEFTQATSHPQLQLCPNPHNCCKNSFFMALRPMSPFPDWLSGRRGSHTPYHPTPPSSSLAHGSCPHFASLASPSAISQRKLLLRGSCNKVRPTHFLSLFYSQLCLSINLNLGMTSEHSTNPSNCRQDVYTTHGDGYLRELSRMLPMIGMEKKKL